jgi:protein phosphatase
MQQTTPSVQVRSAASTHVGLVRKVNEDAVIAQLPVFVVADGMGGHDAGDLASAIVAEEMTKLARQDVIDLPALKVRLDIARERIGEIDVADTERAAGTTISGVVIVDQDGLPYWLVVNLGDSRTYKLTDTRLEQLSVDHSEVQELVDAGRILRDQVGKYPRRNVVTKALGAGAHDDPDYWLIPVVAGDRIMVCSDGLTSEVPDHEIAALLLANPEPEAAVAALMRAALEGGGRDNVSVIVVDAWEVCGEIPSEEMTVDDVDTDDAEDTVPQTPIGVRGDWP